MATDVPAQARAVLWDLDGTLADTEQQHWLAWQQVMADEGVALTREQFLAGFGQRNFTILTDWLGEQVDEQRIERIGESKEAVFRRLVRRGGCAPLPGAVEWVRRLGRQGWRQAIASSAPRANIDVMLESLGLREQFSAIVSAEDVTVGKPDPQVFLKAATRLAVPPSRCVVVEDAAAGVEAAHRAGMLSIGVRSSGEPLAAMLFTPSLADLPADSFERLLGRFRSPDV